MKSKRHIVPKTSSKTAVNKRRKIAGIWIIALSIILVVSGYVFVTKKYKPLCKHCNVVILSIDVLRASQLPCYGYTLNTTPNLCAFAQKSTIFSNAHSQSTWTYPDQASFLTSLYPTTHGLEYPENGFLHPSITTLSQQYKKRGYFTVFIGDSHEDTTPINHGLARGFDKIVSTQGKSIQEEVDLWMSEIKTAQKQTTRPFFVYIYSKKLNAYMPWVDPIVDFRFDPTYTSPSLPPKKTFNQEIAKEMRRALVQARSSDTQDPGYDRLTRLIAQLDQARTLTEAKRVYDQLDGVEQEKIDRDQYQKVLRRDLTYLEYMAHMYDETLARLDEAWKPFLDTLDALQTNSPTIFVFFSDHGENLGDHGTIGHGMIPYDSLTHVPLIIHVPGARSGVADEIIQLVDVYPTLLGLTGIPIPNRIAGHNLSPVFNSTPLLYPAGTYAITELKGDYYYLSLRTARWRLLERTREEQTTQELFDMTKDPGEAHDVSKENPQVVAELTKFLHEIMKDQPSYPAVTNIDI